MYGLGILFMIVESPFIIGPPVKLDFLIGEGHEEAIYRRTDSRDVG